MYGYLGYLLVWATMAQGSMSMLVQILFVFHLIPLLALKRHLFAFSGRSRGYNMHLSHITIHLELIVYYFHTWTL